MNDFTKQWNSLVKLNMSMIYNLPLEDFGSLSEGIVFHITKIFDILIKLKNKSFYTRKEIETVFLLTKNDINDLNYHLQLIIEGDELSAIPLIIYYVIADLFDDLIHLMESEESYEGAKNLLEFRAYWFRLMSIKLPVRTDAK